VLTSCNNPTLHLNSLNTYIFYRKRAQNGNKI
jgi:hypothetical protein